MRKSREMALHGRFNTREGVNANSLAEDFIGFLSTCTQKAR